MSLSPWGRATTEAPRESSMRYTRVVRRYGRSSMATSRPARGSDSASIRSRYVPAHTILREHAGPRRRRRTRLAARPVYALRRADGTADRRPAQRSRVVAGNEREREGRRSHELRSSHQVSCRRAGVPAYSAKSLQLWRVARRGATSTTVRCVPSAALFALGAANPPGRQQLHQASGSSETRRSPYSSPDRTRAPRSSRSSRAGRCSRRSVAMR